MDFSKMSDEDLIKFRNTMNRLHNGIGEAGISLCRTNTRVHIKDNRMNDLVFNLFTEAHNELCERFKIKIE